MDESRHAVFFNLRVAGTDDFFHVAEYVGTVNVTALGTDFDIAFPERMASHELGSIEAVFNVVARGYGAVVALRGILKGQIVGILLLKQHVGIGIERPFACLSSVVAADDVLDVVAVHFTLACNLVVGLFVNEHGREVVARLTVGARGHGVGHADGMIVVQHVVESEFSSQHLVLVVVVHQAVLLIVVLQIGVLSAVIGLTATAVFVFGHTEDVKPTRAIIHIQFLQTIDVVVHARHRAAVETEALTDGSDGLDADDGLDGGVVFGTALVAHLPSVDVDERSATANNLHATVVADDAGNLAQNVARCSRLGEITALHGSNQCIVFHFYQRT